MKNLLRMSLFIIARAGLCLAVVAWIVGQWWTVDHSVAAMGKRVGIVLYRSTWSFTRSPVSTPTWRVKTQPAFDVPHNWFRMESILYGLDKDAWQCAGVSYASSPAYIGKTKLSFDHWLIVTLFTAFNIALHFIYRKRPEGQPCEV